MRVLVTGHLGYIGTVLVPMLVRAGHKVTGLDSDLYSRCTYAAGGKVSEVAAIRKDVRDVRVGDFAGFDAVLHLAALSNDPLGDLKPGLTDEINHLASVRIAELAKLAGVSRFVFASSCSNYGQAGEGMIDETEALLRIEPASLEHLLHPTLDPRARMKVLTKGLPASPGAASGAIAFSSERAEALAAQGKDVVLVRMETSPEDIQGMYAARAILT